MMFRLGTFSLLLFIAILWAGSRPIMAAQLTVTTIADGTDGVCDANCTFREAVTLAGAGDEVVFASPLFDTAQTITLVSALPTLNTSITITGRGANLLTIHRSGGAAFTIFTIGSLPTVTIKGLTISGGAAPTASTGGGITNFGILNLQNCAVSGNSATNGGGIITLGGAAVSNITGCTISGNSAIANGGAVFVSTTATTNLTNTTVSTNTAGFGAVVNNGGTVTMTSCTVTLNTSPGAFASGSFTVNNSIIASNTSSDLSGSFTSGGFNLISNSSGGSGFTNGVNNDKVGVSALLGPLTDNGGRTFTHALLIGSPAIDAGNAFGLTTDQRGRPRPFDNTSVANVSDGSDMGALEQDSPTAAPATIAGRVFFSDQLARGVSGARVVLTDTSGARHTAITSPFGYYLIAGIDSGQTYVITVEGKGIQFTPQVLQIDGNLTGLDLAVSAFVVPPSGGIVAKKLVEF